MQSGQESGEEGRYEGRDLVAWYFENEFWEHRKEYEDN